MKPIDRLRKMQNKSWMYRTEVYLFGTLEENADGSCDLYTNIRTFHFPDEPAMVRFLKETMPVDNTPAPQEVVPDSVATQLQQVLLDNIERIQEDKEYIPQAMAISKQVNTLINLTNLEYKIKNKQS